MSKIRVSARGLSWVAAIGVSFAAATTASAQSNYPNRPVNLISDSAPGSSNDVSVRIVAEQLGNLWRQQVVVLNYPGAGGGISARTAAQATPDGYNFYMPAASVFLALKGAPGTSPNLPVELPRDFVPVAFVSVQPIFLAVSPKLGVNSVAELVAMAKEKPGAISFAATGKGRITHLTMELLQARAGIKLTFVPYAGGPAAAMNDVTTGRVGIVLDGYSSLGGAIDGNLIKAIGVGTSERLPQFPDLPTVAETVPGFFAGGWNIVVAPIGTPADIVKKVSEDVNKVLDNPDVIQRFEKLGTYPRKMSADQVGAFVKREQDVWRPILEKVASEDGK